MFITSNFNQLSTTNTNGNYGLFLRSPQIPSTFPSIYYTDKIGWTKISGTFVPKVTSTHYIAIGDFDQEVPKAGTSPNTLAVGGTHPQPYYYIVDAKIELVPCSSIAPLIRSISEARKPCDAIHGPYGQYVIQNPESGVTHTWSTNYGTFLNDRNKGSMVYVNPSTTRYFTLTVIATRNGCSTIFSERFYADCRSGVKVFKYLLILPKIKDYLDIKTEGSSLGDEAGNRNSINRTSKDEFEIRLYNKFNQLVKSGRQENLIILGLMLKIFLRVFIFFMFLIKTV